MARTPSTGGDRLTARAGGILSYFTRHGTAANLVLVLMIVAGLVAFPRMRAQFFPDVITDTVTVTVAWDGAGAEDVDAAIVQVLEPTLLVVEGVESAQSTSDEGRARIRLEFAPGYNMDRAAEDVQLAVDSARALPPEAEEPSVSRGGWRDRVTDVVITGPVGVDQLGRFADEFAVRLFQAGVTQVTVQGVAAPSTIVEVPSLSLIRHDIGLSDISAAIAREVATDPAGDISGAARVRTGTAKRSAEEIAAIALRSLPDGSSLTIGDVALVRVEGIDRDRAQFVGDNPAIQIRVDRGPQGDAIGIQETVDDVARAFQATLPAGMAVDLVNTRAEQISGRLALLLDNGLMGLGLVVLLLFLFLNARTAFWVAAGIPAAMLAAIALMYAFGLTLNMMSLFALILTLGIVVDDAIVVGEHADFRVRRLGESPVQAAENAARRMFTPVFCATLTTVIAFFGLMAIGGRFGALIADIPFTVIVVLLASLVECFLVLPNHMSHAIAHSAKEHWYDWPSRQVNRGFGWVRDRLFRPFMGLVVTARYPVLAGAILLLATQATVFLRGDVQWRFFSSPEQGEITGNFAMLPGATREDTFEMMREMQRATAALGEEYEAETGVNPLDYVIAEIGGNAGRGLAGAESKESFQLGAITIVLVDIDARPMSSGEFVTALQDRVVQHPMAETVAFRSQGSGPAGDAIDIRLSGAAAPVLKDAAEALKAALMQFPEVSALEDSLPYDKEEMILDLTPQGQALGFTIDDLGRALRERLNGLEAASYPDGPRSATIRVELPEAELTADFLDGMQMRSPDGLWLPLADIVTAESRTGFSSIRRENGVTVISVNGDLADDDPERASAIMAQIEGEILPEIESRFGVGSASAGLAEQERDFMNDARTGLILCVTGIYLVLAWIFSSWTRPLVVMSIIPFGLIGTIWGHQLWGVPMSIFTVVGLIGMTGIIINDSIVLVTTVDEYAETRGLVPAIIDGTADRLRPIMLTTLTTVLGLTPLLYERSSQAEFLKPTVITLVYGLGVGMFLVLLVVPALMAIQQDVSTQFRAARRALGAGPRRGAEAARWPALSGAALVAVLFGALVLPVIVTGAPWPLLAGVLPATGFGAAMGLYAVMVAGGLLVIYATGVIVSLVRRKADDAAVDTSGQNI